MSIKVNENVTEGAWQQIYKHRWNRGLAAERNYAIPHTSLDDNGMQRSIQPNTIQYSFNIKLIGRNLTTMVQLPATDAIEYVAACWVPGAGGGDFCRGTRTRTRTKTKTRTITKTVRGAYARSPNFNAYTNRLGLLCIAWSMFTLLVAVYSWPNRSVTDKLGPVAPRGVDARSPNFQGM